MMGTPPPADLGDDRHAIASWYAKEVLDHDRHGGHPGTACQVTHDLIAGALHAGVVAEPVEVPWMSVSVPLHEVFAPFRRRPGGEADKTDAFLAGLWAAATWRRPRERRWIP